MPLCALAVYLMADILKLGKSIDEEEKYMRSAKKYHPYFLILGFKVSITKCQPEL